jgi:two-component system phosphate regulon sensor histidine kinase PhoR
VRKRIFFKLLAAFVLVIMAATLTLDFSVRRAWERSLTTEIERNLNQKTVLFAHRVEIDHEHSLQDIASQEGQAAGARATIIDHEGNVLADSEADPKTMENHARRKEFVAALTGNMGTETRRSHTLGVPFLYVAAPISGGAVRLAYPLSDVEAATAVLRRTLVIGSALAFACALMLAGFSAWSTARRLQRIVEFADNIAAGNLSARISESSSDEIGHVAAALDKTGRRLEESFAALKNSQR